MTPSGCVTLECYVTSGSLLLSWQFKHLEVTLWICSPLGRRLLTAPHCPGHLSKPCSLGSWVTPWAIGGFGLASDLEPVGYEPTWSSQKLGIAPKVTQWEVAQLEFCPCALCFLHHT